MRSLTFLRDIEKHVFSILTCLRIGEKAPKILAAFSAHSRNILNDYYYY